MRLASENFDFWPITTPTVGSVVEEATNPWAGAASAACASGAFNVVEVHPAGVLGRKYLYRVAGKLAKLPENTTAILRLLNGEATKLELSINEAGELRMWNGVAHPTETPPKITAGEWFVAEVLCQINAEGNGLISWRFNGVQKAAEQAFAVGNLGINKARFGNPGGVKSGTPILIDGLAINDDQGSTDNSWVGVEPDPPPTQLPRYWGADIAETEASGPCEPAPINEPLWDQFEADAGRKVGIVHMGDPWEAGTGPVWDGFFAGASDRIHARGAIPMKSLGGPANVIQDVNAEVYDDGITAWAKEARDWGHPFYLRLWWEMNLREGFPWGMTYVTGAEYVEAWRRVHGIVSSIAHNVTFVWCPNILFAPTPETDPFTGEAGNMYPGDEYVDWVGFDGYNGQNPAVPLGWRTSQAVFLETYERLVEKCPTKPQIICEVACSEWFTKAGPEPPHKAEWLRQFLQWTLPFEMPNVRALVLFNWYIEHTKGRADWAIESSESATAAVKEALEDPYYLDPPVASFADALKVPLPGEPQEGSSMSARWVSKLKAPHLKHPFRVVDGIVAQVEQDSAEEIEQCVEAVLRTPVGSRIEEPEYGLVDPTFEQLPPNPSAEAYLTAVAKWEPRAHLIGEARLGELGELDVTLRPEAA
jgi:hypothetical protein